MKVLGTYIVQHEVKGHEVHMLLLQCECGRKGKWFLLTAGAYGTRDMQLKSVSARKAAELIAATQAA